MAQQRINVQAPIERIFAKRWSTRAFDAEKPVPPGQLAACLEAARWAPSCFGEEPWRFVVADRFADEDAWRSVLATLAEKNQLWARNSPVLIVTACISTFSNNGQPNRWCEYDAGQAAISLCLQATQLGLATHQMGGFDANAVRAATGMPGDLHIMSVIALGHPAEAMDTTEAFREMETAPRKRKPIESIALAGCWQHPWLPPASGGWEARYQETRAESLPWFHAELDDDIARTLDELDLNGNRMLDLGCGPGTQAVALAKRGFAVTASDISWTAIDSAHKRAKKAGVNVDFIVDDILSSHLKGPFDVAIDRGVFHCFADATEREAYARTVASLLVPGGYLLLKCFHRQETRPEGPPSRLDENDIRSLLGTHFDLLRHWNTAFASPSAEAAPKALFCILQCKEKQ